MSLHSTKVTLDPTMTVARSELTSDVERHGVADAVSLDVVRDARVDAGRAPLHVLHDERLVGDDHAGSHVVHQGVLLKCDIIKLQRNY